MCGRYTVHGQVASPDQWRNHMATLLQLTEKLDAKDDQLIHSRFNVAPRQQIPVVKRNEDGGRRLTRARWGLLPAWAKTSKDKLQPINARDDKLDGRMWGRLMVPEHRVLLPADGYYEWIKAEKKSEKPAPFFHEIDGGELFCFAGLINATRVDDLEEPITTTALITTSPNQTAARVHDRMPAILADPEAMAAWLSPEVSPEEAMTLIGPIADDRLQVRPASKLVNAVKNQGPELLDPAATPAP